VDSALDRHDKPVLPPPKDGTPNQIAELLRSHSGPVQVSSSGGPGLVLPPEVCEALNRVVEAMSAGQAVLVAPVHQRLTTQQAANLLGISHPTFVKLLKSGEIDYEQPGRHRRVRLSDVLDFRRRRSVERRKSLDRMVEIAEGSGMYERTTHQPGETR